VEFKVGINEGGIMIRLKIFSWCRRNRYETIMKHEMLCMGWYLGIKIKVEKFSSEVSKNI
jgi:hypothetical protein